jgi:hypothetical protein
LLLDERLSFDDGEFIGEGVEGGNEKAAGSSFNGDET